MKRTILLFLSLLFVGILSAQQWTKNLPTQKASSEHTFYDYQDAFYSYWESYKVKDGKYIDDQGNIKKASGWKQFKRWEYFWETRIDKKSGHFVDVNLTDIFKQEKYSSAFKNSGELWISKGPFSSDGGYAGVGRINTIAYHPTNANMFWVGTASGGLWVTEDGGSSWSVLNDDMQALGVADIIIPSDYASSKTIYLATGDRDAFDTRSIGLLKSTDGGANWQSIGLDFETNQNGMIYRVLLNPEDNETILVSGNFGTYKGNGNTGAWTKISSEAFIDMEFKPGDFNTIYGSTKSGGIFVSTNGGSVWQNPVNETDGYRVELAVTPANALLVYAVVVNSESGLYGIYKSEDSGLSFNKVYDGTTESALNLLGWDNGDDAGGQGWYDLALVASPVLENTIFVGGINTWRSTNGGTSWGLVNHWYGGFGVPAVHADKHYLGFQTSTGILFEGNDGGLYKTSENGVWTDLTDGIVNSQIYRLGTSATVPGETIAGLQDNGTKIHYEDSSWEDVKGGDGTECIIDYTNVEVQYGAYVNGQVSKTTNHWLNSDDISANIPGDSEGAWVTPYIINPIDPDKLYIGYGEIWKTVDGGVSFTNISKFRGDNLHSIAISNSDTSTLYAATLTELYHTNNSGGIWSTITATLPVDEEDITSIAIKDTDPNTVWVTMGGFSGYGVFESTNAGVDWTNIARGLPKVPCNTIVQNKLNTTEVELYAGTDIGVYMKLGSDPWVFYSTGLPNVVISELEIYYDPVDSKESLLKAATYGRGLWETKVYSSGVQTGLSSIAKVVETIYPNPSNGQFRIDLKDYRGGEVDVEVRSLSGKLIYKSVLTKKSNTINLSNYANGVYVLQVKKDNKWLGQNLVIQK